MTEVKHVFPWGKEKKSEVDRGRIWEDSSLILQTQEHTHTSIIKGENVKETTTTNSHNSSFHMYMRCEGEKKHHRTMQSI